MLLLWRLHFLFQFIIFLVSYLLPVKLLFSSLRALFLNAICFRSGMKGFKNLKDNIQMIGQHIHLNHECGMRSFRRRDRSLATDFLQVFFFFWVYTRAFYLSLLCVAHLFLPCLCLWIVEVAICSCFPPCSPSCFLFLSSNCNFTVSSSSFILTQVLVSPLPLPYCSWFVYIIYLMDCLCRLVGLSCIWTGDRLYYSFKGSTGWILQRLCSSWQKILV